MKVTLAQQRDAVLAKRREIWDKYLHCVQPEMQDRRQRLGTAHMRLASFTDLWIPRMRAAGWPAA